MVQPAFEIGTTALEGLPDDCRLLMEVSGQSLNYIVHTKDPYQLYLLRQYRMYTTSERSTRDLLEEIIADDPILQHYAHQATVIYNFPGADIIPAEHYSDNLKNHVAKLITGDTEGDYVFDEQVRDWNMHNVYRISRDIHSLCKEKFTGSQYWHMYTMLLLWSKEDKLKTGNLARVIFYNDKFVVAFFCDRQLQLLQTFAYQTPEDVAYYLLLVCRQFGITQQEIVLHISGLIDTQSALYTELLKYFAEVDYEGLPETYGTNGLLEEFPGHYFSPLLKMSLCV
jgi:hypothetical protein